MPLDSLQPDLAVFFEHLSAFLLGMPRLFAVALSTPFLGTGILEGQMWFVLVLGLYLPIHPLVCAQLTPELTIIMQMSLTSWGTIFLFILKEVFLGLCMGMLAGIPFWALQSAGFFMDNQRGAAQAEETDILSGKSTSVLGGLLFQSLVYLFYSSGAFLLFLGVVYSSYEIWPVTRLLPMFQDARIPLFFGQKVAWLMTHMMLLSAPVCISCLLVDISLGLINRFAPQLNAYVLAMPIKCGLAMFLLCFYLKLLFNKAPELFQEFEASFMTLRHFWLE